MARFAFCLLAFGLVVWTSGCRSSHSYDNCGTSCGTSCNNRGHHGGNNCGHSRGNSCNQSCSHHGGGGKLFGGWKHGCNDGCGSGGLFGGHGGCGNGLFGGHGGGCGDGLFGGLLHGGHGHGVCDCDFEDHCYTRAPWVRVGYTGTIYNGTVGPVGPIGEPIPQPQKSLPDGKGKKL